MKGGTVQHSILFLALWTSSSVLAAKNCMVCLPTVEGNKESKEGAMLARANVTRTFPKVPEGRIGECAEHHSNSDSDKVFFMPCPDEEDMCLWITNGIWVGRSCGKLASNAKSCNEVAPIGKFCTCGSDNCNVHAAAGVPTPYISVLTFAFLMVLRAFSTTEM